MTRRQFLLSGEPYQKVLSEQVMVAFSIVAGVVLAGACLALAGYIGLIGWALLVHPEQAGREPA